MEITFSNESSLIISETDLLRKSINLDKFNNNY